MDSDAFVQLALDSLKCTQKELAIRLRVSPTQISKWKKGDSMSLEWQTQFRQLIEIGEHSPSVVLWTGSVDNAQKWEGLIAHLASVALSSAETGYNTEPLRDEMGTLCCDTLAALTAMGVTIPKTFPSELDVDMDVPDLAFWETVDDHPIASLISDIFRAFNDVYGFYRAYIADLLLDDDLDLGNTSAIEIESSLLALAAAKVAVAPELAPRMREFKRHIIRQYEEWLSLVKEAAFRANVPLRAELLDLVYQGRDALGHDAEAESLGVNASRIHPDIYMNELLVGMRIIHQVLPAILKKLEIDQAFALDELALRMPRGDGNSIPPENHGPNQA